MDTPTSREAICERIEQVRTELRQVQEAIWALGYNLDTHAFDYGARLSIDVAISALTTAVVNVEGSKTPQEVSK